VTVVVIVLAGSCRSRTTDPLRAASRLTSTAEVLPPSATEGQWSSVVDGLRGRLIATAQTLEGKPQVQIDVELENVSDGSIAIQWWDAESALSYSLEADDGPATADEIFPGGSHWIPNKSSLLFVPSRTSMRMTAVTQAYEYLANGGVLLRPETFHAWIIPKTPTQKLFLRGRFQTGGVTGSESEQALTGWKGPLELPRVALP
jgi:hypothetical protein